MVAAKESSEQTAELDDADSCARLKAAPRASAAPSVVTDDALLHAIYASAEAGQGFGSLMDQLAASFNTDKAQLAALTRGGLPVAQYSTSDHIEQGEAYLRHWKNQDPRFSFAMSHRGQVFSDVDVLDSQSFEKTEVYNECLAPIDIRYSLFTASDESERAAFALAIMRDKRQRPFDGHDVARLTRLVPHLQRALRLHHICQSLEQQKLDLQMALDRLPTAIVILDALGRISGMNTEAQRILSENDPLHNDAGTLSCQRQPDIDRFDRMLMQVQYASENCPSSALRLQRRDGSSLNLSFFRLGPQCALTLSAPRDVRVLVTIFDPRHAVTLDFCQLQTFYRLSPAESALATALANGTSLIEYAHGRGISEATVRTQSKRLFAKTGATGQADLVRLLLRQLGLLSVEPA